MSTFCHSVVVQLVGQNRNCDKISPTQIWPQNEFRDVKYNAYTAYLSKLMSLKLFYLPLCIVTTIEMVVRCGAARLHRACSALVWGALPLLPNHRTKSVTACHQPVPNRNDCRLLAMLSKNCY